MTYKRKLDVLLWLPRRPYLYLTVIATLVMIVLPYSFIFFNSMVLKLSPVAIILFAVASLCIFVLPPIYFYLREVDDAEKSNLRYSEIVSYKDNRIDLLWSAFEHSSDGIVITDLDGRLIEVNTAFEKIFGYLRDEVLGKSTAILRSSQTTDSMYREMWQSLNTKGEWQGEITNRRKDGSEVSILLSITPIYTEGQTPKQKLGYLGIEIDLTERKRLEENLRRGERLSAIGRTMTTLAHEMRNSLSSIKMNTNILSRTLQLSDENKEYFRILEAELRRMETLATDTLIYARPATLNILPTDIRQTLSELLALIDAECKAKNIIIMKQIGEKPINVRCDEAKTKQVLQNILHNAIESMPDGGTLNVRLEAGDCRIIIRDTGVGIEDKDLPYVFEPFFTTKKGGTGLGLAMSEKIMRDQNGHIQIQSRKGKGTQVLLRLPLYTNHNAA